MEVLATREREMWIKDQKAVSARKSLQPNLQHRAEEVQNVCRFLRDNVEVVHSMTIGYEPEEGKLWLKYVSDLDLDGYKRIQGNVSSEFLSELPQDTQLYDITIDGTGADRALCALRGKHRGEARSMNVLPEDCGWSLMDGPCPHVEVNDMELESLACLDRRWLVHGQYGRPGAAGQHKYTVPFDEVHYGHCHDRVLRAKYEGSDATWAKEAPDWSRQTHLCFAPCQRAEDKHWRREARATTLGVAFSILGVGSHISSKDIYAWFCNLPVLARGAKKRRTGETRQEAKKRYARGPWYNDDKAQQEKPPGQEEKTEVLVLKLRPKSKAKKRYARGPWYNNEKPEQKEWAEQLDVWGLLDWKGLHQMLK